MRRYFPEGVLERLPGILAQAEDLTGSYFKLTAFDPAHYPFDVRTLRDLDEREVADGAFAMLSRYEAPNRLIPGRGLTRPLYRICLQDHNLLKALERERGALALDPLLLFVLTHELCHIVRFCDYRQLFEANEKERAAEEARIHRFTQRILEPLHDPRLDALQRRYRDQVY